jgi:gliding motility-associated-like protein
MIATSSFGCRDTQRVNITVHPGAVIFMEDSVVMYTGETYQLNTSGNCVTFNWFPVVGLSNASVPNPVLTPEISTLYYVDGLSSEGCKVRDSVHVVFDEKGVFTVPNAFSPGKGVNNTFKLHKRGIASLNYFRIYNRWGNVVFETKDVNEGWDGSYQGTPQPLGVYVYEVKAVAQNGSVFVKSGNVTLLR